MCYKYIKASQDHEWKLKQTLRASKQRAEKNNLEHTLTLNDLKPDVFFFVKYTLQKRSLKLSNPETNHTERFTHAFTACHCVFKEITLVDSNQGNYFENATACMQ